ncbi:MAG TPA: AsmA family protein [Candidatus Binatia bacterium]
MRRSLFFILALICGGLAVFALSLLVFNSESLLLRHLERTLGRKILAREVQITFIPALGLHLKEFSMADDPIFSSGAFLTADALQVRFKFLPLFLYQLRIKEIILRDPVINVIRNHRGIYNFSSIGLEKPRKTIIEQPVKSQAQAKEYAPALIPSSSIQVINGSLRYLDQTNGTDMIVSRLDLKVVDLQDRNSFAVELAMAVFAMEQNFQLKAAVGPLVPQRSFRDLPLDGELRFDRFDMGKLRAVLPVIKKGLPKALDLRGVYSTQGVRFKGTLNRPSLKGQVEGTDASFRFD